MAGTTRSEFIPPGAPFTFERFDQGEDFKTTPGGRVVAPWPGTMRLAPKNPGGFGTHYGLFTPSGGPYAGRTFYIGHAWAFPGNKRAGGTIAITGRGWESWMGNAKGIPGHVEIGFWPPGSMSSGRNVQHAVESPGSASARGAAVLGALAPDTGWMACNLSWYDPALGGINTSGAANPHARTASGEPYDASKFTCAAPPAYKFGTRISFKYRGKVVTCRVNDRGGAIVGNHFDLSRAAANALGIVAAGRVMAQFTVGGVTASGSPAGITRPGGVPSGPQPSSDAALLDAFKLGYADDPTGTGAATSDTVFLGGQPGATQPVDFFGLPIPSPSIIPGLPSIPGIGIPSLPDPLSIFKSTEQAISTVGDFFKWIAWLFHPRNILRVVEFLTGITLLGAALHSFIEAARGDPYYRRKRARQERRKTVVKKVIKTVAK